MNTEHVARTEFCHSCLNHGENWHLHSYVFNDQHIKSIFQVSRVTLCYLCRTVAKKTEAFISNVQNTQMTLYSAELINTSSLKYSQNKYKKIVNLIQTSNNPIETVMNDDNSNEGKSIIDTLTVENILIDTPILDESKRAISSCQKDEVQVKLEMKYEGNQGFDDGIDDQDVESFEPMKDEELSDILKLEIEADEIDLKTLKKTLKKLPKRKSKKRQCKLNADVEKLKKRLKVNRKVKKEDSKMTKSIVINQDDEAIPIELITLTEEQCLAERSKMSQDRKYIAYAYKCEDCIKGFNYKETFAKHMEERHDQKYRKHRCRICKQCLTSHEKRDQHMNVHFRRHKCVECGFTSVMRRTLVQHYLGRHAPENKQYLCPHCSKTYKLHHQMKKHVYYAHGATNKRVECNFCGKSYASKDVLKWHMRIIHPEHTEPVPFKLYPCGECGANFRAPSLLKKHQLKHTDDKAHYCVECDKSFKSDTSLKKHLKTVAPHVSNTELPFPCPHCEKRFGVKRDVVRHVNSIHLNNRPFQCDQCEKGYVSKWSLTEHIQLAHEGYKRPLRFPCHFCHKVFDRMQILKAHIRTHTGERPYQCSECSSQFSQLSVMKTHVNLVHLKLTRDGKPKGVS